MPVRKKIAAALVIAAASLGLAAGSAAPAFAASASAVPHVLYNG